MTDYLRLAQERAPKAVDLAESDPYLQIARERQAQQQNRTRTVIETALRDNPELAAERRRLSQTSGLAPEVVQRNLEELRVKEKARAVDLGRMAQDSPILYRQLTDPNFTTTAVDDLGTLGNIERALRDTGTRPRSVSTAEPSVQAWNGPRPTTLSVISGLAQSIPQAGAAIRQGLRMQMGDALEALGLVKRDPVYLADQQRKLAQAVGAGDFTRPDFESSTAAGVYGGVESFLRAIPGVAASVAMRSPTPAMIAIGGQTQAEAYGKYRSRGGTPGESFAGATGEALVEIATEYLPGKYLAESLGKTGAKEFILNFIKKDALGEQAATILQDAIDTAIANPDKTWEQYLVERPDAAYRTLVATITQAGLMGGVNTALRRVAEMGDKQGEAAQTSQALGAALKGAEASALLKRDPAQFREVMNALSEDGVVYVDAQVLNQMPPDVLAQMEGVQAELPDALATSSPVAVKVADILTLAPGTPLAETFTQNARRTPDSPTLVETEEAGKVAGEFLKNEFDRVLAQAADTAAWQQGTQTVQQTILGELNTAGRFTPDVNEAYATLQANFFSTMAARVGMTPEALYERYRLRVAARQPGGGGQVLNAQDTTDRIAMTPEAQADADEMLTAQGLDSVDSAYEYMIDDRSHGDEFIGEAAKLLYPGEMSGMPVRPWAARVVALRNRMAEDTGGDPSELDVEQYRNLIRLEDFQGGTLNQTPAAQAFNQRGVQPKGREVPTAIDGVSNVEAAFAFAGTQSFPTNRDFKIALQDVVNAAAKTARVDLSEFSEGTERYLIRLALADAQTALRTNANAVGWYNEKVNKALRLVSLIHPEIATDPQAKFAFVWAMAVTSNGLKVDKNFELAETAYRAFKETGRMPTDIGIGTAAKAINKTLKLYNTLIDKHGFEVVERFMTTMQPAKDVEAFTGMKVTGENKTTMVYGAAALGPKIGNGFFMNLYGRFGQLTMDRWLMRTWGRWTGTLVENNPEQVRAKRTALKALIKELSPADKKAFEAVIKRKLAVGDLDAVGAAIWKASQKPENRELMNAIGLVDDAGKARLTDILGPEKKGTERVGLGSELRKIGNALTKYIDGQKEAPSGPPERANIRKVFSQVLAELQQEYPALTMSDLQALLWYPEKRLYDAAKTADEADDGYEDDEAPDYANAAAKLARAQGVSDADISGAIAAVDAEIQAAVSAGGARPKERGEQLLEQPGYHGSPTRGIAKFSTDFIGTGEGAQAYGWGLYFAGKREIAEWYREKLAGEAVARVEVEEYTIAGDRNWIATTFNGSGDKLGRSDYLSDDGLRDLVGETAEQIITKSEAAPGEADGEYVVDKTPGQLYEVDIPEDSEMLLWDKPLSEQPQAVREILANFRQPTTLEAVLEGRDIRQLIAWVDAFDRNNSFQEWVDEDGITDPDVVREAILANYNSEDMGPYLSSESFEPGRTGESMYREIAAKLGDDRAASEALLAAGIKGIKYLDGVSRDAGEGTYNYVVFSGDDVAIRNQFYQEQPATGPRGTFNPETMLITLGETADLSTFLHESGHFFLEVLADLASQPNAPAGIAADMKSTLKWFGVPDLATWNSYTLEQKRPYHEKWAESFEQYLFEGKAPTPELQPLFRRFRSWMLNVYKSLSAFMRGRNLQVNDEVRQVFDRMLATDEQIAQAEEAAGMLPDFEATNEAIEQLQARSLRDLKWTVRARGRALKALEKQAADLRKGVEAEVRAEVGQEPVYRAIRWLRTGEMTDEEGTLVKAEKGFRLNTDAIAEMYPESMLSRPDLTGLKGMTSKTGLSPDLVADMFGYPSGDALVRAILAAEPMGSVIEGITDQRMLERHGELATPEALEAAANEAVHNEARARSLATELKSQTEMMNERRDTGRTNAAGRPITVNTIVEAAKQFALNLVARRRVNDLKSAAWQHRAAEARAGRRWQEATAKGETEAAVQAKRDQVLNNAAAKALQDAQAEVRKIAEFFKRVTTGSNEKLVKGGRDPDVVNAMRAILAAYNVAPRLGKSALEYMEAVSRNDPAMYAALKPGVDGAMLNAQPLTELTMEELRGLNDELRAMWQLAKRSRQMEIDGNLLDLEDAANDLVARMDQIGIPAEIPGEKGAITDKQERGIKLRFALSILTRVEQWAERLDGKFGGPFLRLVFQPVKDAADRFRTARVDFRKRYQALLEGVAPFLPRGPIAAPEIGYTFGNARDSGAAELLHAILHTGNDSNKRKLLLGRGWATENADGTMDTSRWDAFLQRMTTEGKLVKEHYDFAQGVWDLLEQTKPLAQETHRQVFGRYFAEVTANEVVTPFGTYRGGYVPAQTDARLVKDAKLRELAEGENESMAYTFPASPSGFTKSRVEYNKPLMLDLRTLAQHMDKVLLFSHMQGAVTDVRRLLTNKSVSYALDRIDPGAYEGMLIPWLNRAARQVVETPVMGDRKLSRFLSGARSRAGMALMFANLSNTFQQITGFSMAAVKVKPGLMMKATAQFIADPKAMKTTVADASAYMKDRMLNEVSAMNDAVEEILLDPTMLERGQAWTQRHAYFMQAAVDNTMSPIIWTAAYNQAIEKGETERDAVRFADGTVRQTQGSTLPEDVSRFETGPGYARLFTQFVSYFNMMANTNATAMKQIVDEMGLRKGAGKLLYVALAGLLVPIWVAEMIAQAFRGGPEDEDDDGYLDDWLMAVFGLGTIRGLVAQVPIVGQAAQLVVNRFNDNPADDKFSLSPAVSLIESSVSAPSSVYKAIVDDGNAQKAVRDVAAAATMITGLPIFALGRPLGYVAGMADDRIEPTSPLDVMRGLVTGTASPESKTP